jgi:TRAP-type C4-dicarboxylate transport system substrate-binding protein
VKVTVFPAGQLYAEGDVLAAMQRGEVDMGVVPAWSSVEPAVLILDLPFQFTSWDNFHQALDGPMGKLLIDAYASHGIKNLWFQDNTTIDLVGTNKHIVKLPADLAGLRMRTISEAFSQAITLWGAAPTEMSGADTYAAVQRGTVDGLISGVSFFSRKWYEVTPYISQLPFSFRTNAVQMNLAKWNSLAPEQQAAITTAAATALASNRTETPKTNVDAYGKLQGGLAKQFYVGTADEISKWQGATFMDSMHAWYVSQAPALGQKILDALK